MTDLDVTIQELYVRAHWLVIADLQKFIAAHETATENAATPTQKFAKDIIPMLRKKVEEYQDQYELALRNKDTRLMRCFLANTRASHRCEAEFSFIPKDLPE